MVLFLKQLLQILYYFIDRDMVSRVVQSMTSQVDDKSVSSVSVSVFKMKHEVNEYLRRKEINRVLSKLPVQYIGNVH